MPDEAPAEPVAPPASDVPIPPPPTDPSGPAANGAKPNLAGGAEALNQEAVAKALNSDVPPRDAAERVTFATWAIVTGKSPGGIFNELPKLDDDVAAKMAERARAEVVAKRDMRIMTERLVDCYQATVDKMRGTGFVS